MRVLREEERELMKNKPGWVVGTLFGEPIFKTLGKNELNDVHIHEYYAHQPTRTPMYEYNWPDCWL